MYNMMTSYYVVGT